MVGISSFPLLVARFGDLNHPTGQKSHATGIVIKNWSVLAWPCLASAQISAQMVPTPKMIYSSFSWHIVLSLHVLVGFLRPKQSSLESAECWIYTLQHSSNRYNPKWAPWESGTPQPTKALGGSLCLTTGPGRGSRWTKAPSHWCWLSTRSGIMSKPWRSKVGAKHRSTFGMI